MMRTFGLVCLVLLLWVPAVAREVAEGEKAPKLSLRDREGRLTSLESLAYPGAERPGRPKQHIVLDFFRTDCKACIKELPQFVAFHERHKGQGVQVMLVALLEEDEGTAKLDSFLARNPLPFTVLIDSYGSVAKDWVHDGSGIWLPSTFFIDRDGVVRKRLKGIEGDVETLLMPLISGSAAR